jgi:hypothetical protein
MKRHLNTALIGGMLAGLAGALAMSLLAIVGSALSGHAWYAPLELAGSVATATTARFDAGVQVWAAIAGVATHFAVGAAWGALFGAVVAVSAYHLLPDEGFWYGALYGVFVWAIDLFVLLPRFDPAAAHAVPLWFGALTHVGYGAVLGLLFHRLRPHHDEELQYRSELDHHPPKTA